MMSFTVLKKLPIILGCVLVSCGIPEHENENHQHSIEVKHSSPIDTEVTPSDAVFISSNVNAASVGEIDNGKLYWFFEKQLVLDNDVTREIRTCENEQLLICITHPIKLVVPTKIGRDVKYNIDNKILSVKADSVLVDAESCSFDTLEFEVLDDDDVIYRYVLSKQSGLLYYNVRSKKRSFYREMFRLSGSVFSYEELCD